jgi:hypothetical protein
VRRGGQLGFTVPVLAYKQANLNELLVRVQDLRTIEQIRGFEVVCNAPGMPESNYDVALIFDFEDADGLQTYQDHPTHKAFGAFISQIRESRACIDYEFQS